MNKYMLSLLTLIMISGSMNIYGMRGGGIMPPMEFDNTFSDVDMLHIDLESAIRDGNVGEAKRSIARVKERIERAENDNLTKLMIWRLQRQFLKRLHVAILENVSNEDLLAMIKDGGKEILAVKLAYSDSTPLQYALKRQNKRIVQLLLQAGAQQSAADKVAIDKLFNTKEKGNS